MQDPINHGVFCQWSAKQDQQWFYNYRQKKLQKENPDHPFAMKKWFNRAELSYQKNCLIKGNRATSTDSRRVTRITIDIDTLISLEDIKDTEKLTGSLRFSIVRTRGNNKQGRFQISYHFESVHPRHYGLVKEVHRYMGDLWNRSIGGGIDKSLIGDMTRFDRLNLKQKGVVNFKTGDCVEVLREGYRYTLTEIKEWLESLGYDFTRHQTFARSLHLMRKYFSCNKQYEGRQEHLSKLIGVPYRSFKYLIKKMEAWGEVKIYWRGNNSPGCPRRSYILSRIFHHKNFNIRERQQNITKSFKTPAPFCIRRQNNKKSLF